MYPARLIAFILMALIMLIPFACGSDSGGRNGGGGSGGPDLFMIANFTAADVVIGQPDFTTTLPGLVNASTLGSIYGDPLLHKGVLYMPDYQRHRVLGFNQVPVVNGASADFVIGQPDFTTNTSSPAADGANGPQTMKVRDGKLLAAMYGSNSVYIYDTVPIANGASADIVVGQTDFNIGTSDCAANRLFNPESLFIVDGKLIVSDSENDRVVIWNTIPIVNGASADIVLGQPDPDTCNPAANPPTASSMNYPGGLWSDGKRLIVADADNNRVLIWNTFPTYNGQPADVVLGQTDMVSKEFGVSDRDLYLPYFLASNGTQLFVADYRNHRVLIWDTIPSENNTPADGVLGQPDFDCNNINENDGNCGTTGEGPGPRGFRFPSGLLLTGDMLIVLEQGNHRAMVFRE